MVSMPAFQSNPKAGHQAALLNALINLGLQICAGQFDWPFDRLRLKSISQGEK
jgi:hypothetical protein